MIVQNFKTVITLLLLTHAIHLQKCTFLSQIICWQLRLLEIGVYASFLGKILLPWYDLLADQMHVVVRLDKLSSVHLLLLHDGLFCRTDVNACITYCPMPPAHILLLLKFPSVIFYSAQPKSFCIV